MLIPSLFPYWPLIRKLWWLVPVTALAITAATLRIQRDSARADGATLEARLAAAEAAGRAQAQAAALSELAWQRAADRLSGETNARLQAIYSERDSLARRLFDYADRARAGQVPGAAGGAGGNVPALGDGSGISTPDAALDDFRTRARKCDAVEAFWQSYAASVGVPVAGTSGPN